MLEPTNYGSAAYLLGMRNLYSLVIEHVSHYPCEAGETLRELGEWAVMQSLNPADARSMSLVLTILRGGMNLGDDDVRGSVLCGLRLLRASCEQRLDGIEKLLSAGPS